MVACLSSGDTRCTVEKCVSQDYHVINSIVETKCGVAKDQLLRKSNGECLKEDHLMYFPVPDVKVQTADDHVSTNVLGEEVLELVGDTASVSESGGIKALVNGKEVALFVWKKELYCVDAHCPHMGGPIHCGEIEELPCGPCVVCPWHKWCFSLKDGHNVRPGRSTAVLGVHPVQVDSHCRVRVGFKEFDPLCFTSDEF